MLGHQPFFHNTIRKYVVIFGSLFNDIVLARVDSAGIQKERMKVPLLYGPKEKWVTRLYADTTLTKSIATTVPRMSFEMLSMNYDQSRKQPSTIRHRTGETANSAHAHSQYMGVPYNFEFSLSVYVRNLTDGLQIVETILPFFLPDYTVTAVVSQEVNIIKDIPVILKGVTQKIDYEGAFADGTRLITWDFEFSLKGWLFGPVADTGLIMGISANVANANAAVTGGVYIDLCEDVGGGGTPERFVLYPGFGTFKEGEPISVPARRITGNVLTMSVTSNTIHLNTLTGKIEEEDEIRGLETGAHGKVKKVKDKFKKIETVRVYQKPITANAESDYGYTTHLEEHEDD